MPTICTQTGHLVFLDKWGHGKAPYGKWSFRPATLTIDDGDGHYAAWSYTGSRRDAAMSLVQFIDRTYDDAVVWVLDGSHVSPVRREYWAEGVEVAHIDEDGEPIDYNYYPEQQPGGLCMG